MKRVFSEMREKMFRNKHLVWATSAARICIHICTFCTISIYVYLWCSETIFRIYTNKNKCCVVDASLKNPFTITSIHWHNKCHWIKCTTVYEILNNWNQIHCNCEANSFQWQHVMWERRYISRISKWLVIPIQPLTIEYDTRYYLKWNPSVLCSKHTTK